MLLTNKLLLVSLPLGIALDVCSCVFFLIDAAAGGGVAAAARGGKEGVVDALTRKTGMSLEEACQILNLQKDADLTQLTKVKGFIGKKKKRSFTDLTV